MCRLEVHYNGKYYQFEGCSIDLADRLAREFGQIEWRRASEAGTEYRTTKGAEAFISIK
jgi:hypothetical protein